MRSLNNIAWSLLACLGLGLMMAPSSVCADNLEDLLQQVGTEYAESYSAPFINTFGPNLTSNFFSTADISWHSITFGVGVKFMSSTIDEEDQTFSREINDIDFAPFLPVQNSGYNQRGDIIMSGPTIFGSTETDGTIRFVPDNRAEFSIVAIPGLVETTNVPMFAPELYVGGLYGLKATLRYLPEIASDNYGKTKFMGYGLQWSAKGFMPKLPVDLMVGFFSQDLDVGDLLKTTSNSYFVGASKSFSLLTAYAGLAKEDSEMTITYHFDDLDKDVSFTVEGEQSSRAILGGTLSIPGMKLNLELGKGSVTTYSAGLMFGI
ncbi:MAG: hypothetical protein KOO60_04715 [Gemmatimonadales bacterium]|nr:hypothetical protein [Gemmatimonadales bacterium]